MKNTDKFIKLWEQKRKRGKLMYILVNSGIYCIVYWGVTLLFLIGLEKARDNFDIFIITIIIYIISLFISWKRNEDKYNNLINNK